MDALVNLLPLGTRLFPEDDVSDLPVRFFVAEIIREQITKKTGKKFRTKQRSWWSPSKKRKAVS